MIVFDIETVKDDLEANQLAWFTAKKVDKRLKDPEKIDSNMQEVQGKFGLSPLTGKIILIGILSDNNINNQFQPLGDMYFLQLGLNGVDEKSILTGFWNIISTSLAQGGRLASYNGKQFDLPFIFARSLFHKIPRPQTLRTISDLTNKYNNIMHVDVYNVFGEGSQSEWANKFGISPMLASDGQHIQSYFDSGDFDKIKEKNKLDLIELASIFRMMEPWV